MLTTLTLACIETAQGFLGAVAYGLDHIRRDLTKTERKREQVKKMADSVHQTMERL